MTTSPRPAPARVYVATVVSRMVRNGVEIRVQAANKTEAAKAIRAIARRDVEEFWFNGSIVGGADRGISLASIS
jgi:hypothetical protein